MVHANRFTRILSSILAVLLSVSALIGCRSGKIGDGPPPLQFADDLSSLFGSKGGAEEEPTETLVPTGMIKLGDNDAFIQVVGDRMYCYNTETGQLGSYPREASEEPVFRESAMLDPAETPEAMFADGNGFVLAYRDRLLLLDEAGNSVGERDGDKFRAVGRAGIIITVVLMSFSGLLLFVCSYPLMCVFTSSEEVARIGATVLKMVAFTEPFFGLQVVLEGIFYGVGKTRFPFLIDTLSMWGIRILFTFLCVNVWGLGLRSVWICMIADNLCKAFVFAIASPKTFRRAFQKADSAKIEKQL